MSQLADAQNHISIEEYLEGEIISDIRHEYIDGEVFAMSGASLNHNRISGNIFSEFRQNLKGSTCEPFNQDLKLKLDNQYRYPDIMVVCDNDFKDDDYSTQTPVIIIEVLSKSTRKIDTTEKLKAYLKIDSLKEYILIEQDIAEIEVMRRKNHWQSERFYLGDSVYFDAIDLTIDVSEIYDRVDNDDMLDYLSKSSGQNNVQ